MRDYQDRSHEYDVEDFVPSLSWLLQSAPEQVAQVIADRTKYGAKVLSAAADVNHRRALELLSRGLGFKSWYRFKTLLCEVEPGLPAPEAWRVQMKSSFLLLGCNDAGVTIPAPHLEGLHNLTVEIAKLAACPETVLLDKFTARLCSAGCWGDVVNRSPLTATDPLYTFSTQWGHFESSPACCQMEEEVHDLLFERTESDPDYSDDDITSLLQSYLTAQPSFADAALHLAQYYLDTGNPEKVLAITQHPIAHLLQVIPKEYEGTLSYWSHQNRPLLRLIYAQIKAREALGDYYGALDLAEYLLEWSPSDGIQIRGEFPVLLKALGRADLAKEWTKAVRKQSFNFSPVLRDTLLSDLVRSPAH